MTVPIKPEPKGDLPRSIAALQERCAICRKPTRTWTAIRARKAGEQVALCSVCASAANPADIPSKDAWCRREQIAARSDGSDA